MRMSRVGGEVRRALRAQFGSSSGLVVAFGAGFIGLVGWAADTLLELWNEFAPGSALTVLVVSVGLMVVAGVWAGREAPRFRIRQDGHPGKSRALVCFLSIPTRSGDWPIESGIALTSSDNPLEPLALGQPYGQWRMPMEAIRHHVPALERVVVIPSADSGEGREDGSYRYVAEFADRVRSFMETGGVVVEHHPSEGVDYEDLEQLEGALTKSLESLRASGFKDSDILIDVSSGKGTCSAVGALRALDEDLRFEYVSTTDYRVRTYDVRLEEQR